MLNAEYFKNELIEIRETGDFFAVKGGKLCSCNCIECKECDFDEASCENEAIDWILSERKEPEINWDNDIDWMRVPIGTEVIVHNIATVGVHRAKFAVYVPKGQIKYRTFAKGAGQEDATTLTGWDYCELSNKEDVEKYRKGDKNMSACRQEKVMISQPMHGKMDEEIAETRERAIKYLESKGYEVVNSYFMDQRYSDEYMKERGVISIPVCLLAKSLDVMSMCDAVYFCKGWHTARGCCIEHEVAEKYGLEMIYERG